MRLRHLSALLLFALVALASPAQDNSEGAQPTAQTDVQTAPPQKPATPDTGRITGTIFCNDTHRPARGAIAFAQPLVEDATSLAASGMHMVRVAMDGSYTIEHLHPGNYAVIGLLPGYLSPLDDIPLNQMDKETAEMDAKLARNGTVAVRNNDTTRFDVTIERGASVSGHILYSDGSPATQVTLSAEDIHAKPAAPTDDLKGMFGDANAGTLMRGMVLHQSMGTDDQGNFRISGLRPGTYRIAVTQPQENASGNDNEGIFFTGMFSDPKALHIYSGDTFHKNAAKTYQLRAGDDLTGIDITIPTDALHRVEGHITTLGGTPVPVATITLTDASDNSFVLSTAPARDGSFLFSTVPPGTYKLSATGASLGTVPDAFPPGMVLEAAMLKDAHPLSDGSTSVIVQDSDVGEAILQLTDPAETPAAAQATTTPPATPQ